MGLAQSEKQFGCILSQIVFPKLYLQPASVLEA